MGAHDEPQSADGTDDSATGAGGERAPNLSADVVEAIVEVRGQLGVVREIDPASTALIVIDMQNFFLAPGSGVEVPAARDIVDSINRLAVSMRSVGGTVVWVRMTFEPNELADNWTAFLPVNGATKGPSTFRDIEPGQPGHELWPLLDVGGSDLIVDKRRFSAFIQGSSDLQQVLDDRGIDTLIIVGTLTNVCCESTARDAMMLNYRVIMIDDGTATISANAHRAALDNVAMFFGEVQTTDHVVDMLASAGSATA